MISNYFTAFSSIFTYRASKYMHFFSLKSKLNHDKSQSMHSVNKLDLYFVVIITYEQLHSESNKFLNILVLLRQMLFQRNFLNGILRGFISKITDRRRENNSYRVSWTIAYTVLLLIFVKDVPMVGVRLPLQPATPPHWAISPMAVRAIPASVRRRQTARRLPDRIQMMFWRAAIFIQLLV